MNAVRPVSLVLVRNVLRLADVAVVVLAALAAYQIYLATLLDDLDGKHIVGIVLAALLTANIFPFFGLYDERIWRNWFAQFTRPLLAWTAVGGFLIVAAFVAKVSADFSRGWVIVWFITGYIGFVLVRIGLRLLLARWTEIGRLAKAVAVVGAGPVAARLIEHLKRLPDREMVLVGVYDDAPPAEGGPVAGVEYRGAIEALLADARRQRVDLIAVALPWSEEERIVNVLKRLWTLPVDIRLAPDMIGYQLAHCSFGTLGDVPVLNVFDRPLSDEKLVLKRLEDFGLASALLLAFAPIMLLIALAIKLTSPGPVLFRQPRYGFNNHLIEIFKFRTMRVEGAEPGVLVQARQNDPRLTPIGGFLRSTSLDELPQLFNVLNGSMSLVGPRPHANGTRAANVPFEEAVAEYAARHRVKPGLTGWAQVNGWRGETDTLEKIQRRVEHDLFYIENWSLRFDLKILLMTVAEVLRRRNAW
ncbi:MAG: undecaprenyl-phosphate glucose phosphotransferase [Reyranellaceae bacterium]